MRQRGRLLIVLAGALALAGCSSWFLDGDRVGPAPVELTFLGPDAGCASANPATVHVWRSTVPGKPQQVEWTVVGGSDHRWVLTRARDKGAGDHFPPRQIRCGDSSVRSGPPINLPAAGMVTWQYLVEVYECPPNPRPEPICVLDPAVIIKDRQ